MTVRTGVATVYVMSVRFEMRVDDALMEGIDGARGNETRAAWIKRTLAAALDQSLVHPGRTDAQDGTAAEHSQSMLSGPAPQRAPAVVFPASALVNESDAEREARRRARASAERNLGARQAKLNAAKLRRKES